MGNPDPRRALEIHRSYLIIAASRHSAFAEEACASVVEELKRMQRDFGMSQEMVNDFSEILLNSGNDPRVRAKEASELIGLILAVSEEK